MDTETEIEADTVADWMSYAACTGAGISVFFPRRGESSLPAKEVCAGCPVRAECLEYALDENIKFGVWGGESERSRKAIRSRRRLAPAS